MCTVITVTMPLLGGSDGIGPVLPEREMLLKTKLDWSNDPGNVGI